MTRLLILAFLGLIAFGGVLIYRYGFREGYEAGMRAQREAEKKRGTFRSAG